MPDYLYDEHINIILRHIIQMDINNESYELKVWARTIVGNELIARIFESKDNVMVETKIVKMKNISNEPLVCYDNSKYYCFSCNFKYTIISTNACYSYYISQGNERFVEKKSNEDFYNFGTCYYREIAKFRKLKNNIVESIFSNDNDVINLILPNGDSQIKICLYYCSDTKINNDMLTNQLNMKDYNLLDSNTTYKYCIQILNSFDRNKSVWIGSNSNTQLTMISLIIQLVITMYGDTKQSGSVYDMMIKQLSDHICGTTTELYSSKFKAGIINNSSKWIEKPVHEKLALKYSL